MRARGGKQTAQLDASAAASFLNAPAATLSGFCGGLDGADALCDPAADAISPAPTGDAELPVVPR
jgi:hypothetical protein